VFFFSSAELNTRISVRLLWVSVVVFAFGQVQSLQGDSPAYWHALGGGSHPWGELELTSDQEICSNEEGYPVGR